MCGIAGIINWGDSEHLAQMTDLQTHRGPDDRGVWETYLLDGTWVGLGSRRLAILDLSPAGHMPMMTPDEQFVIVYNGEIYNYLELRKQLEAKGYVFRSRSDTEAVLYLYQEYGVQCVNRLNGMFAFAIFDREKQELFLARDHFGIKPFYYCHQGQRFAFASEIKPLLTLPDCPRKVNWEALHQYLTFLWVPDPLTMFAGIYKLPAGHYAVFKAGHLDVIQYWDVTFPPIDHTYSVNSVALAEELRTRFCASVERQMISDVPLGAFLSAGLDSSSIVAAMAHASTAPVKTYTIAFPPDARVGSMILDDPSVAARTAAHFGCNHHAIIVEPNVVELLPKLVWHMDEPTADPALIMAYLINREARRTVTVMLSGVGGDELFSGYRRHQAHDWAKKYRRLPSVLRQRLIEPVVSRLPVMRGTLLKDPIRLAKKMVRSGSLSEEDRFLMDITFFTPEQRKKLYTSEVQMQVLPRDSWGPHKDYFSRVQHADFLNRILYVETKAFMASLNLTYNDKMSMASSVEVRVPFLDWQFAEWVAWNIPPHLKLHRGVTKYILREAMKPLLPEEVLTQKKAAFGAPIDHWLVNELREMVDDLLGEEQVRKRGYFKPETVRQLVEEQRSGKQDWSMQIWQLLTLELWMETFL